MAQPAAAPLKLIFLDIDGVICCNMYGRLEEPKLELLKSVCQRTGAKVVLSTDWRRVPQLKVQLISTLKAYGIATIGATPCRPNWLAVRPEEIVAWIKGYASAPNAKDKPPIGTWVSIDDRPLLQENGGDELRGHFVRTKLAVGITDRIADRMVAVLNGDASQADGGAGPDSASAPTAAEPPPPSEPATPSAPASASFPHSFPAKSALGAGGAAGVGQPPPRSALSASRGTPGGSRGGAYSSGYNSGYATPPPMGAGSGSGAANANSNDAKAVALRAYATGRAASLTGAGGGGVVRGPSAPPTRYGGASGSGSAVAMRSPAHVGGPAAGSAQWWSSRSPAGVPSAGGGGLSPAVRASPQAQSYSAARPRGYPSGR